MMPVEPLLLMSGSAIQPVYAAGRVLYVGRPEYVRAHVRLRTSEGSLFTAAVLKWQGTIDPTDPDGWEDIASRRDDTGAFELEHTFAVAGAAYSFLVDARGYVALRLVGKSTSGAGTPGDELRVSGVTW